MLRRQPTDDGAKVTFALPVADHAAVSVVGDFNGWDPMAHPLRKRSNGTRSVSLDVAPGDYRFKYLASGGAWFCEPDADGVELNEYHETNSVLSV